MNKPKPISDPAVRVLSWLLDLAVQRAGYTVRGVRDWATSEQIETGVKTWGTAELMRAEAKRGRVLQHDARPPGDSRPSWFYRISHPGAEASQSTRLRNNYREWNSLQIDRKNSKSFGSF